VSRSASTRTSCSASGKHADPGHPSPLSPAQHADRPLGIDHLGDLPLKNVRHSDARAFVSGLSRGLAPNTARQAHAITRTIFRSAVADKLIAATPFEKIPLPKVERGEVQPPSLAAVRRLVEYAPKRLQALVVLAAGSGLRSGEMLGLTVDRVDFLRREVRVDRQLVYVSGTPPQMGPPKTPESRRTVPVPQWVADALAAHLAAFPASEDGLIFQSDKGGPHPTDDPQRSLASDGEAGRPRRRAAPAPPAARLRLMAQLGRGPVHDGNGAARTCPAGRHLGDVHA